MIRNLAIAAALSCAVVVGLSSPASAQSYGGITLSFGSGGYGGYDYGDDAYSYDPGSYYAYTSPWAAPDYYYNDPGYDWRAHEREEQIERWQQEQQRRRYWQHERREDHHWREGDEDDGD